LIRSTRPRDGRSDARVLQSQPAATPRRVPPCPRRPQSANRLALSQRRRPFQVLRRRERVRCSRSELLRELVVYPCCLTPELRGATKWHPLERIVRRQPSPYGGVVQLERRPHCETT